MNFFRMMLVWIRLFLVTRLFHLDGYVNKQNCLECAPNNPKQRYQKQLHSHKVNVWCAMSAMGITGSYIFENFRGRVKTVNSQHY